MKTLVALLMLNLTHSSIKMLGFLYKLEFDAIIKNSSTFATTSSVSSRCCPCWRISVVVGCRYCLVFAANCERVRHDFDGQWSSDVRMMWSTVAAARRFLIPAVSGQQNATRHAIHTTSVRLLITEMDTAPRNATQWSQLTSVRFCDYTHGLLFFFFIYSLIWSIRLIIIKYCWK